MSERKNEARWLEKYQRWQINVQKDGKRKTFYSKTPGTKGKIDAEKQADKWLKGGFENPTMRFSKLYELFLAEKELLKGKSSSDLCKHEYVGRKYLLPALGTKKVENISLGNWQDCINNAFERSQAKGKPLSAKSLKNIRASMTAVYAYARRHNIPLVKPEYLQIPKSAPVGQRKILTPEDIQKVFSEDKILTKKEPYLFWYINLVRFILVTGLRPGEAIGIRPKEDINNNLLTIHRSINRFNEITDGKNKNAQRSQYLSTIAQGIIQNQRTLLNQHGIISPWLFPSADGSQGIPHTAYEMWIKYRDSHNITQCTLYELRHTMVSATKNEVPAHLLKMILGHTDTMDTFGIYGHEFDNDLQIMANATDDIFNKILNK